jgi:intracellular sulfur oxidation DsrE/DsrF family protein
MLSTLLGATLSQAADKSLADTKVVLQISDNDPTKQTLVLNVANNLINHYGAEQVDVEIVAFGPGLRLLFADNANSKRIAGLVSNNVKFSACGNTMKNMAKQLGKDPQLNSNAKIVPAGVVRIIELENQGYKLIKP